MGKTFFPFSFSPSPLGRRFPSYGPSSVSSPSPAPPLAPPPFLGRLAGSWPYSASGVAQPGSLPRRMRPTGRLAHGPAAPTACPASVARVCVGQLPSRRRHRWGPPVGAQAAPCSSPPTPTTPAFLSPRVARPFLPHAHAKPPCARRPAGRSGFAEVSSSPSSPFPSPFPPPFFSITRGVPQPRRGLDLPLLAQRAPCHSAAGVRARPGAGARPRLGLRARRGSASARPWRDETSVTPTRVCPPSPARSTARPWWPGHPAQPRRARLDSRGSARRPSRPWRDPARGHGAATRLARARLGLAPAPPRPAPSSARPSWRGPSAPARDLGVELDHGGWSSTMSPHAAHPARGRPQRGCSSCGARPWAQSGVPG
jgi:hypothetical protein